MLAYLLVIAAGGAATSLAAPAGGSMPAAAAMPAAATTSSDVPAAATAAAEIPPELAAVAAKMRGVRTISASLHQEKELAALAEVVRNEGTFAFERPRRLAMDLSGAGGTRLVVDGDVMVMQYKGVGRTERTQLSRDPRARAVAEHLFLLLDADPPVLAKVYRLTVLRQSPLRVRLTPLADALARVLAHVEADIDGRGFVSAMTITEGNGDRTVWRFDRPVINQPIPAERFAVASP
jgi:outer membrane lipoprotein-sorting protein